MIRRSFVVIGIVSVLLLALFSVVYAQDAGPQAVDAPQAALGTAFTYQGQLKSGGAGVSGSCEMAFRLFDAATVGNPVGVPLTQTVTVNAGFFTAQLDFGASAFNGQARWLEIAVKCGSEATFTTLSRQALTAAPYALYAPTAGTAANVTNGVYTTGAYANPAWLTSLAGGKISGAVSTATSAGSVPWGGVTGIPAGFADGTDNTATYQNVVIVAKSGGDYTTISAALTSIINASATNHYLVKVMPGVYTETVTMKHYVDIEGAGELATTITYTGTVSEFTGTVVGANNAELRFLTVANTGGGAYAIAIYNSSASPHLTHVTATASGGTESNRGVNNYSSSPTMTNVAATGSGGTYSYGVRNTFSSPMMTNVAATGSGGTYNYGVNNTSSSPTIQFSTLRGYGGTQNYGIYNFAPSGTHTVTVNSSQVTGSSATIRNDDTYTTRIGASLLDGGAVFANGGTVTCAGVYDEAYAFYASTCP